MSAGEPARWLDEHPWIALAPVLALAAVVILAAGAGTSFSGDDLYYFGRQAYLGADVPQHFDSLTLEYLFVPYNGHLQIGGKLIYEGLFATFGAEYAAFRVVAVMGVLACVALFFELARVRIGTSAALVLSTSLALLGAAWEVLLWPFDMHTTLAVAAGLGSLLALERRPRHGDAIASALLVVALCFIEIALAFVAAAALAVLLEPDRWRRAWVFVVPSVLFAAWYAWAQSYASPPLEIDLGHLVPSMFDSLRATLSSLTGTIESGADVNVTVVGQDGFGSLLAIAALLGLAWRLARGGLPKFFWPMLVALAAYWVMIAFAAREEDSSRYMFAGALLLLLAAVSSVRERRPHAVQVAALALLVALALPANLGKLGDGSGYLTRDALLTRAEFAMLELAGDRGDPDYLPVDDVLALGVGASPYLVMPTAVYLDSAERIGSLADPLDRIRGESVELRRVADWTLVGALGIAPRSTAAAPDDSCEPLGTAGAATELAGEGAIVSARGSETLTLTLARFAPEDPGRPIGQLEAGQAAAVELPAPDAASELWLLAGDGAALVCPLP